jgi:beta-galactosidase
MVKFAEGHNTLRAVGTHGTVEVMDEMSVEYQTEKWSKPAQLTLTEIVREHDGTITLEARMLDEDGVLCLDAANRVRFGLVGDGRLIDNLGTVTGSRVVQMANGRAQISLHLTGARAVAAVSSDGVPTAFVELTAPVMPGSANTIQN